MVIYLVDSAIQLLNNWGQNSIIIVVIIWAVKPAVPTIFKSFVDKALTGNLDLWNVTLVHLYLRILYKVSCKQWFLQARCDRSGFSPFMVLSVHPGKTTVHRVFTRLCSKKNWEEPSSLNLWNPECPAYNNIISMLGTKNRYQGPWDTARVQPCFS